jgi:DNA-directed RNA polymerase subunit RPC12/RpoP
MGKIHRTKSRSWGLKLFEIYHHKYREGKCDECGKKGKIQITDGIGRCQECAVKWLIKKAKE